jgi:predicted nucleotidyltransferase
LAAAFPVAQVRLFGSRARGTARPDSDVDLLITVPDHWLAGRVRVLGALWREYSSHRLPRLTLRRRGAIAPFERIADLTFFAVQTRYDDSLEIDSGGSCFGQAIANVRHRPASSGQSILG